MNHRQVFKESEQQPLHIQTFRWRLLFIFTRKFDLFALGPGVVLAVISGVLEPAMTIFLGKFFDAFADFGAKRINGHQLEQRTLISVYSLLAVGVAMLIVRGGFLATWLIFGEVQVRRVRNKLFKVLLEKDLEWFEKQESGIETLLSRFQTQIRDLQTGISQSLGFMLACIVEGFAALGLSLYYSWKLTLVILASIPVSVVVLYLFSKTIEGNISKQNEALTAAAKVANSAIQNVSLVKCFNTQKREASHYEKETKNAGIHYIRQARANALQMGYIKLVATTMFVQGFWYGSILVHKGHTTPGNVMTTFWACLMAIQAIQDILPRILLLERALVAASTLEMIINTIEAGSRCPKPRNTITPSFCEGDVEFRNVSFTYPSRPEHYVLHQSTFFFPAGETTFIIGKSGSGKSTLGDLLMRFRVPASGCVLIDGNDIACLDTHWLRNNVTLVQQHSILFNESILRNIALGSQHYDSINEAHLRHCLEMANLRETISELPRGLRTMVGSGGSTLSGGQKQRVAIARARLRDTPILILDESTSALDHKSKTLVTRAIRAWRKERTTIIITHDMSQISDDDFVYVMENGSIAAEGYYRHLKTDLQTESFHSRKTSPVVTSSFHFDFGFEHLQRRKARGLSFIKASNNLVQHRQVRKNSLNIGLRPLAKTNPLRPRNSLLIPLHFRSSLVYPMPITQEPSEHGRTFIRHTGAEVMPERDRRTSAAMFLQGVLPVTQFTARPSSMYGVNKLRASYVYQQVEKALPIPEVQQRVNMVYPTSESAQQTAMISWSSSGQMTLTQILRTAWPALGAKSHLFLVVGILAVFVHAGATPVFSYILIKLFQTFYLHTGYKASALKHALSLLVVAAIDGVAAFLSKYLLEAAGQSWIDKHRSKALTNILNRPMAWFDEQTNTAVHLAGVLDRDAEEMRNILGRFSSFLLIIVVMMTVSLAWALVICWKISLVVFSTGPVLYLLTKCFDLVALHWESQTNHATNQITAVFADSFSDIRTVRALTLESYFHRKCSAATKFAVAVGLRRALYSGLFFGLSECAIHLVTALIFWYAAHLARSTAFSTEAILQSLSLLIFATDGVNSIVAYMPQLASSIDSASRLLRLSNLPAGSHEEFGQYRLDLSNSDSLSGPISFINLTFNYASRPEQPALDCFNLSIPSGLCTAIVGASGSGKSTIASLLLGLYSPTTDSSFRRASGPDGGPPSLTISGRDIRDLHLPTLRKLIAVVPQNPVIFRMSIRDNITYGLDLNSPYCQNTNIEDAARTADIHDFILTLPQQYATVIGEGGLGVSGGQAQRIVIARALVRKPRILILDEATSALDRASASVVIRSIQNLVQQNRINRLDRNRTAKRSPPLTVLMITHAKEMMSFADNVVVMHRGQVKEEGGYEELLARRGALWDLLQTDQHEGC